MHCNMLLGNLLDKAHVYAPSMCAPSCMMYSHVYHTRAFSNMVLGFEIEDLR